MSITSYRSIAMRAAVVREANKPLVVDDMPDPSPGPDDAVLKVEAAGICRSDWHGWQGDWKWIGLGLELPAILGHEFGGEIVELGANVQGFSVGDRVTAPFHHGCGGCEFCLAGRPNLCAHVSVYGFAGTDGAYAQYLLVTNARSNLIRLPEGVSSTSAAALGCRYMTGYHAVARGRTEPGEWVAVQGAGGVGLSAIQTAVAVGAQVIAVDIADDKLDKARETGAAAVVNSKTQRSEERRVGKERGERRER